MARALRLVAIIALVGLAGCGAQDRPEMRPERSTVSADGYPIGEVVAAFMSVCSDLATSKAVYKKALADGWKIVENPEQSGAAGYVAATVNYQGEVRLARAGEDMILIPILERTVAGEQLFLSFYEHRTQVDQTNHCKLFDPGEQRSVADKDLSASLGKGQAKVEEHTTTRIQIWQEGMVKDQRPLEFAEIGQQPVNLKVFGFSGFLFHASRKAPLASN